ncbi:MAG: hypothetical protein Q8S84_01555 [bacterium]|nr:hypothetical protein [bacterium]MDP3380253.1 hypothetical protein [bacterium]
MKYFFQFIVDIKSNNESKSITLSFSAKSKYNLFPTLDHKFTLGINSIHPEKVISLSTTSSIFPHCLSISFLAIDSTHAIVDNTNFIIVFG